MWLDPDGTDNLEPTSHFEPPLPVGVCPSVSTETSLRVLENFVISSSRVE